MFNIELNDLKNELNSLEGQIAYCWGALFSNLEKWEQREYAIIKANCYKRKKKIYSILKSIDVILSNDIGNATDTLYCLFKAPLN